MTEPVDSESGHVQRLRTGRCRLSLLLLGLFEILRTLSKASSSVSQTIGFYAGNESGEPVYMSSNISSKSLFSYHDMQEQILNASSQTKHNSETAYRKATVVKQAPWFTPKKVCKETCCAETVAVFLQQDEHQIINTVDGLDLADVRLRQACEHRSARPHFRLTAPAVLPTRYNHQPRQSQKDPEVLLRAITTQHYRSICTHDDVI